MVVDVQTHVMRRAFSKKPMSWHFGWHECPPALLVAEMDDAGVDRAILISYDAENIHLDLEGDLSNFDGDKDYFTAGVREFPDRLIWYTDHIDPKKQDYMLEVEKDIAAGAQGIKLFPAYQDVLPWDERFFPLYQTCTDRNLPIIMAFEHWNTPRSKACMTDYAAFLKGFEEKVVRNFSRLRFLLTHWGCFTWSNPPAQRPPYPGMRELATLVKRYDTLATDIAAITFLFDRDYPFPTAQQFFQALVDAVGAEKIMWGTDWPWTDANAMYRQCLRFVTHECRFLNDRQKELILSKNAVAFLDI